MALNEPASAEADVSTAGFDDDSLVDLSFAGPEPVVPTAPWYLRLLDLVSAYLPLVMMAVLAAGTWWLVRNAPRVEGPPPAAAVRHEPDYVMSVFTVQRFAADGTLRTQIEGETLRHFPDNDTLEVEAARIRAVAEDGTITLASARRALSNGDGSEVQLIGDARVVRPAADGQEAIEFRGEFLHAFRNIEQVRSDRPVLITQGASIVRADGMAYDNLARVVTLQGRSRATFVSRPRQASAPR